ncbi:penicillin acylase family protein [Taibaiella soli]|uniref:Penicillin acylase family protein n=1 Tax=Taibaiella soli TaxID=1649169 RepID=A0A2W2B6U6_9BACT|nr:penicillin acylase family protein [Taibaiella soli]PZF71727.1 penicillin acylase family protein [Taibaiella soli]
MRFLRAGIPIIITAALVWTLDRPHGTLPALGRLLDPVNGWAANAEPVGKDFTQTSHLNGLLQPVTIWMEDRLVPHVRAQNDHDLYFTQGFIHAYFRLWQMDMETRAAGGNISEVAGEKALKFDRMQRRKGMVFGAEHSVEAMEKEPRTKLVLDAYTDGVNAFIHSLKDRDLPLEYKLMGFKPTEWTNLRSALLMKYMADDLTGYTEDFPHTYLRDRLPKDEFDKLFPEKIPGYKPVIPEGTKFEPRSLPILSVPGIPDSLFAHFGEQPAIAYNDQDDMNGDKKEIEREGIGSNNWAISGKHTQSGAPILCNDPHLGLNLPSLWFEMQLQAPGVNTYGVSLPGDPGIVIGFNDSISWGFTNNYRDVKDFYMIDGIDDQCYNFNGTKHFYRKRMEHIKVKGKPDFIDTLYFTLHGPVIYDERFPDPAHTGKKIAVTWMAHRATNELLALYEMNRAQNYDQFVNGIMNFQCPAQNMLYADRAGNIALWGQGQFINKWKDQGKYVMEGKDSLTLWGQNIPMRENPHVLNPPQGYIASANQAVTDSTYPYWYNGHFLEFRSWEINQALGDSLMKATSGYPGFSDVPNEVWMQKVQNSTYSYLAEHAAPVMQQIMDRLNNRDKDATGKLWDYNLDADSKNATAFQITWSILYANIWKDDFKNVPENLWPTPEVTMQLLLSDTAAKWYDDISTPQKETLSDIVKLSYKQTMDSIEKIKANGLEWYQVKNTTLAHLTKLPAFSYDHLKVGGWGNTINAVKSDHGPSWRMIVEMDKDSIRGLGVYPGGQSGNPGSPYYNTFVDHWVTGNYYNLLFLPNQEKQDASKIKYTWTFN